MNIQPPPVRFLQSQDLAFTFSTPAASNSELKVVAFSFSESISALYSGQVQLTSFDPDIDLHALIDQPATLAILSKLDATPRFLSGIIVDAERGEEGRQRTHYSVTIAPSLHRLALGSDARIFQQKSVPDIVKLMFNEHGIKDVKWQLGEAHEPREYCVQYRETHLHFIERLLAEEGIWYFFTFDKDGKHILHLTDNPGGIKPCPGKGETLIHNSRPGGDVKGTFCHHFALNERLRSNAFSQRDYTFKNPPYSLEHKHARQEDNGSKTNYAIYDYNGRYKKDAAGKPFTKYRMEALRVDATTGQGTTNAMHLHAGHAVELSEHPKAAFNQKYLLLSVNHAGQQPQALEEEGEGPTTYSSSFSVMPKHLPYRTAPLPKPVVDGPQMAHVVGPAGEEIYCDEFGRIKVWFPWDRHGKKDEHASCWIRVAQNWAGGKWGHMAIPRIGQEVIVDFLEGDPDQPIVTGRTYHAQNKPPYDLPANKTRMTIKSDTHKGSGFNELRFEDEAGREEIYMHAQKDNNIDILNDRTKNVAHDQAENVGNDKALTIGNNHTEQIGSNMAITVGDNLSETVGKTNTQHVGMMKNTAVGISWTTQVGAMMATMVGVSKTTVVGKKYELNAGKQITSKTKKHNILAGDKIILAAPGGQIEINKSGVFIKAKKIELKASAIDLKSGSGGKKTDKALAEQCKKK